MGEATVNWLFEDVIFVTSRAASPLLLMLSCILSVLPLFTSPKLSGLGEREITAVDDEVPVPLRSTVAEGRFEALLVTVRVPLFNPSEEGVNVTVLFMLAPAAT